MVTVVCGGFISAKSKAATPVVRWITEGLDSKAHGHKLSSGDNAFFGKGHMQAQADPLTSVPDYVNFHSLEAHNGSAQYALNCPSW